MQIPARTLSYSSSEYLTALHLTLESKSGRTLSHGGGKEIDRATSDIGTLIT